MLIRLANTQPEHATGKYSVSSTFCHIDIDISTSTFVLCILCRTTESRGDGYESNRNHVQFNHALVGFYPFFCVHSVCVCALVVVNLVLNKTMRWLKYPLLVTTQLRLRMSINRHAKNLNETTDVRRILQTQCAAIFDEVGAVCICMQYRDEHAFFSSSALFIRVFFRSLSIYWKSTYSLHRLTPSSCNDHRNQLAMYSARSTEHTCMSDWNEMKRVLCQRKSTQ